MDIIQPNYLCYILGITTMWCSLPNILALYFDNINYSIDYVIIFFQVCIIISSNLHWCYHSPNSIYAWTDTIIVILFVIIGLFKLFFYSEPIFKFIGLLLLFICSIFFKYSCIIRYTVNKDYGMLLHVLFRFTVFWFIIILMCPNVINYVNFLFLSLIYFIHIYLVRNYFIYKQFNIEDEIIKGNLIVLLLSVISAIFIITNIEGI